MKKQAVIYARQSSGSDDFSESVAVQIANCRKLANQQQINVINIFSDLNISGKTYPMGWEMLASVDIAFNRWANSNSSGKMFRNGLAGVIRQLRTVDYIIVDDITRLYRPLTGSYLEAAVNQQLIENRVQILQVKGGPLDLAQFDQQLITMLKNQINDEQIAKQRQRSIEVLNKLRDSGIMPTGITAFGLIYDRGSKTYSHDAEKIPVVKYIFESVQTYKSYGSIVHTVNNRWGHLFKSCFWEKSLYEIIRKPIYAGYQYNTAGCLIPNRQGPAVISLEEFLRVQHIAENKRLHCGRAKNRADGSQRHWLPLSGFIYCGNCGSKLVATIENDNVNYFCRCGSLRRDPACRSSRIAVKCSKPYITGLSDVVQTVLGVALQQRRRELQNLLNCSGHQKKIAAAIKRCEERIRVQSIEFARGHLSEQLYHETLTILNQQHRQLLEEQLKFSADIECTQQIESFNRLLDHYQTNSFTQPEFEMLLHETVERIEVFKDTVTIKTRDGIFDFTRHTVCRQRGFTQHAIGKLRRKFAASLRIVEKSKK